MPDNLSTIAKPEAVNTAVTSTTETDSKDSQQAPSNNLQQQPPNEHQPSVPTSPNADATETNAPATADQTPSETPINTAGNSPEAQQQQKAVERDREIVEEFEYLLEKSQQLFSGLGDLPEIGSKYWMPHFQRTFEVYTKLWRFQNQHRLLLEKPEHYGLKRWEVGEIASKIGQLYYRYYLRTSDTNNLLEAFVFYDAIRERNYFKGEEEVKNSALMIKKLRYYARFIVVCLQMNNQGMMMQLLEEVKSLIEVYAVTFNPVDKMEWSLVVKEMSIFMQAVCSPVPTDESTHASLPISYRLLPRRRPKIEKEGLKLRLQEAVIVGNRPTQIKFSELTLDMYFMLQMLERERDLTHIGTKDSSVKETVKDNTITGDDAAAAEAAANSGGVVTTQATDATTNTTADTSGAPSIDHNVADSESINGEKKVDTTAAIPATVPIETDKEKEKEKEKTTDTTTTSEKDIDREKFLRRANPHKYVLYQPHISQVQVYLANAFREISEQGCVLLYLSSDGSGISAETATSLNTAAGSSNAAGGGGGPSGGGSTDAPPQQSPAMLRGFTGGISTSRRNIGDIKDRKNEKLIHTLHPADLLPYTRKPFFLIVESESSHAYKNLPNLFNQPLLCLLSPAVYPMPTSSSSGSIYTFFLHSPIVAFSIISHITTMSRDKWNELRLLFEQFEDRVLELLAQHVVDINVRKFLFDEFLRQIIARHVLCCVVLQLHISFSRPENLPQASPDRFKKVIENDELVQKARYIVSFCKVDELYNMGSDYRDIQSTSSPRSTSLAGSPPQPLSVLTTSNNAADTVLPTEAPTTMTTNSSAVTTAALAGPAPSTISDTNQH